MWQFSWVVENSRLQILEFLLANFESGGEFWDSWFAENFRILGENLGILAGNFQHWRRILEFLLAIFKSGKEFGNFYWQFWRVAEKFGILVCKFQNSCQWVWKFLLKCFESGGEFWNSHCECSQLVENFGILSGNFREWWRIFKFLLGSLFYSLVARSICSFFVKKSRSIIFRYIGIGIYI